MILNQSLLDHCTIPFLRISCPLVYSWIIGVYASVTFRDVRETIFNLQHRQMPFFFLYLNLRQRIPVLVSERMFSFLIPMEVKSNCAMQESCFAFSSPIDVTSLKKLVEALINKHNLNRSFMS